MPSRFLFLHGGPGGHCDVERVWFDPPLEARWWDQPRCGEGATGAYKALVEAARRELARLAAEDAGPVALVGLSFGANVALELARRDPQRVASLTLLSPLVGLPLSMLRLARRLAPRAPDGALARVLPRAERDPEGAFWDLLGAIAEVRDFLAAYWSPGASASAQRFQALLAGPGFVDLPTFAAVVRDHASTAQGAARGPLPFEGPTRLVFGRHDPLVDVASDAAVFEGLLPRATSRTLDAGHFLHLERPVAEWFDPGGR